MKQTSFKFILTLCLALIVAPALSLRTFAQEPPPAPAAPDVAPAPAPDIEPADAPAEPESSPTESAPAEAEPELRELGTGERVAKPKRERGQVHRSHGGPALGNQEVGAGVRRHEAVAILGNMTVEGHVTGEAVSIVGNTTVNGHVDGEAVSVVGSTTVNGSVDGEVVSVLGTTTVNGKVGREVVAVMGNVVLGPGAEVGGDVVAVFGRVIRGEDAVVRGGVQEIAGLGHFGDFEWLKAYLSKCVLWGRPLWIGENLGWAWLVAGGFLIFYMLLALIFPRGIERCAGALEEQPGSTILTALLTALLTPILIILLVMTGVGIALIPFLGAGLFLASLFGKAAVLAWFGRRLTGNFGEGPMRHAVAAVFLGGVIVCVLYMIPILGFLLHKLFGILGVGMVVYVLIQASRRERPARVAAAAAPADPRAMYASGAAAGLAPAPESPAAPMDAPAPAMEAPPAGVPPAAPLPAPAAPFSPPLLSASTLPRVGFWLRLAAGLLDFLLIGIATAMLGSMWFDFDGPGFLILAYASYSAVMWKTKGTTIGGVICGLKVVRIDDRPIDWTIAIVRALAGFLSFGVAGLGFIWVAFDDEKQSWHDKIAGTTIVRVPKGVSLL